MTEKAIPVVINVTLILIYLADGLTKFFQKYSNYNFLIYPSRIVKVLMVLLAVIFGFFIFRRIPRSLQSIYGLLFILFSIFLFNNVYYGTDFNYFLKYSCFLFFAPLFFLNVDDVLWKKNVVNTMKCLVYINLFFIIYGLLTDVQLYKTYYSRFGYNGLLLTAMQSTYFYISSIVLAIKMKDKTFLLVSLISSLFVGTKILLGFLLFAGIYLVFSKLKKPKTRVRVLISLTLIFTAISLMFFNQKTFKEIIETEGFLTALSSTRNDLLITTWNSLSEINFNIITGGIKLKDFRVEMELIDVLMYFGIIGAVVFFFFPSLVNSLATFSPLGSFNLASITSLNDSLNVNIWCFPFWCLHRRFFDRNWSIV